MARCDPRIVRRIWQERLWPIDICSKRRVDNAQKAIIRKNNCVVRGVVQTLIWEEENNARSKMDGRVAEAKRFGSSFSILIELGENRWNYA